jgi:hypothetical protein
MKKVIELLETAKLDLIKFSRDHLKGSLAMAALSNIEEVLYDLRVRPRWETPEQWERRTGEKWPDDWATYVRLIFAKAGWDPYRYVTAKLLQLSHPGTIIVIATESGPPPNNWRPEEGDHENQKDHAL